MKRGRKSVPRTIDQIREGVSLTLGESTARCLIEALQQLPPEALVGVFNDQNAAVVSIKSMVTGANGVTGIYDWDDTR